MIDEKKDLTPEFLAAADVEADTPIAIRPTVDPEDIRLARESYARGEGIDVGDVLREIVLSVVLSSPEEFTVRFGDGKAFSKPVSIFEMPVECLRWETIAVSDAGNSIVIIDIADEPLDIDAKTVRYYCDEEYADEIKKRHEGNRLTNEELDEIASASATRRPIAEVKADFYRKAWHMAKENATIRPPLTDAEKESLRDTIRRSEEADAADPEKVARLRVLEELARENQEWGMYDNPPGPRTGEK